jgi:integrase
LDTKIDSKKGGVIHPKTRMTTFGALVAMLDALKSVPEFSRLARIAFDARPSVTWDSVQTRTTQRGRLSFEALQAIDNAVTKDIEGLRARVEESEQLLQAGRERLASCNFDLFDLATCAAFVEQKYPEGLPSLSALREHDPDLYRYVNPGNRKAHGVVAIKEILYPEARDLVPLVVFLAIESALNPTTLFELCWSDIDLGELLGEPVIRLGGAKWRAGEDPLVPIPAVRIEPVLELITLLTKRVRATVSAPLKDRLFLFNRLHGISPAGRSFGGDDLGITKSDASWKRGLAEFCQDHELEPFTLSQIRATIGDEIAFREGIVVSSQVLGHQDIQTTDKHYVSDGTRWREAEHLGNAMLFRDRWFRTNGKIDPRRRRLTPRMDRGAATPGFYCFDPYDSPWPMQRKDRLCTAYGRCPSCPLAAADIHDAGAVALYMGLRTAIFSAQGRIAGEAWLGRYSQVLVDLDALLKHVPLDVMESAQRFQVNLPPVE